MNIQLYTSIIHNYYTQLYMILHAYTCLYMIIHDYTSLYSMIIDNYMILYVCTIVDNNTNYISLVIVVPPKRAAVPPVDHGEGYPSLPKGGANGLAVGDTHWYLISTISRP